MADLINERLTGQKATTLTTHGYYGIAANTSIIKGQDVGLDVSGNLVKATSANCVHVLGPASFDVDNTTPPSGQARNAMGLDGLAGSGSCRVDFGVNEWDNDATNPVAAANASQPCWVKTDHSVSLDPADGLPAGIVCGVGDNKGGGNKQVHVFQGPVGIALALAAIAAGGGSTSAPNRARAVVTTLQAYGGTGTDTLTETGTTALSAADGVTLAVGDVVFIEPGTTNLTGAVDSGPWTVAALGGSSAHWVLTRPSWFKTGAVMAQSQTIDIGGEGTKYAGSAWRSFAAKGSAVIGTNDPTFWPRYVSKKYTLTSSTVTISDLAVRTVNSQIIATFQLAHGTVTSTIGYGQVAAPTAGVINAASIVIDALASGMGKNGSSDASDVIVSVWNW